LDARLEEMEGDDSLPPGAGRPRIDAWTADLHRRVWDRLDGVSAPEG
jgi:hypothetical protein